MIQQVLEEIKQKKNLLTAFSRSTPCATSEESDREQVGSAL